VSFVFDARLPKDSFRQESRYYNFRKFDVESTITVDDSPIDPKGTNHQCGNALKQMEQQ
jgi:hypothetical protein